MSILIDLALFSAGIGSTYFVQAWRRLKKKDDIYVNGSIKWCWTTEPASTNPFSFSKRKAGFLCPSCREYGNNNEQPEKCLCYEFPRAHYHFTCKGCAHEAIIRPADDLADKPIQPTKQWWRVS